MDKPNTGLYSWQYKDYITSNRMNLIHSNIEKLWDEVVDINNISLILNKDGLLYIQKKDGTLLGSGVEVSVETITSPSQIPYNNSMYPNINNLEDALNELLYIPPQISSLTSSKSATTYEIGTTVTAPITFNWDYNKNIISQTFNENSLDINIKQYTYNSNISSDTNFTLSASDGKSNCSKTLSFLFRHRRYWGVSQEPSVYDSNFILSLSNNEFATSRNKGSFSQNIGDNQYFYYCYPESWGNAVFNVGGFDGGVSLIDTISFTNSSRNTTNFRIYRSDNQNLGNQTFIVK